MSSIVAPDTKAAPPVPDDARDAGCRTLVDLFRLRADGRRDYVAYRFLPGAEAPEQELTFGALDVRARAIAARLRERTEIGDRAILLFSPGLDYIAAFVGCLYSGVIAVPAYPPHPRRPDARIAAIVADCGARVALTTASALDRLNGIRASDPVLGDLQWVATDSIPLEAEGWRPPAVDDASIAMLQYTSGSTASPRGVMLSHANLMSNLGIVHRLFAHREQDYGVFWLPPFHDMGLIGAILQAAYVGLGTALMPAPSFLQRPMSWLETISRFRATTSGAPNFAYDLCVDRSTPEERASLDLSCWRTAFNGAEPIRAETLDRFARAFEPAGFRREAFLPCYGLAEATLMVTGGPAGSAPTVMRASRAHHERGRLVEARRDAHALSLVASGAVVEDHAVTIVSADGEARCGDGEIGEIWVNGPSVGRGYWGRPDDPTFNARLTGDHRVWLRTGDLGTMHAGQLFVSGRSKDLLILGGRNVYPQDVESAAERAHPVLRPGYTAAFAIEDGGAERAVLVAEVSRHAGDEDRSAAIVCIRSAVASEIGIILDDVVLVRQGSIPRTSSGKIRRGSARDALRDGQLEVVARATPNDDAALNVERARTPARSWLAKWLHQELGGVASSPDDTLEALGLESLDVVRLAVAAERDLNVRLDPSALWAAGTLEQVSQLLEGESAGAGPSLAEISTGELPEMEELESRLALLDAAGLEHPFFRVHDGIAGATTRVDGRELLSFGGYNYLGLAGHPTVIAAAHEAIDRDGTSVSASRLISGERVIHRQLEEALAELAGAEAALVFVGGHATNVSTIAAMVGPQDLVVADALAHDSVVQGSRLSGARRLVFPHNDWKELDALLGDLRSRYRRALVVIEGVYSADGDIPDLAEFVAVKRRHRALLMVDEAHSLGTIGATGRGLAEHAGVAPGDVDIVMGTLSKSLASCGGFIAGTHRLIRYLKHSAPGFVFSVGLSPANAGAALAALDVLRNEPERVQRLRRNAATLLRSLKGVGADTGASDGTPIVPVIVGDSLRAIRLAHQLETLGVSVPPMVAPAVPERLARLRFFVTSEHSDVQLGLAAAALGDALRTV